MTPENPFADRIRDHDNDRFLTALFAPEHARADMMTLYAFNLELAKIRETVSEPLIGRMRLQFWRDAVDGMAGDGVIPQHEVAVPLAVLVRRHGGLANDLQSLIEARETDLDDVPPDDMAGFETYAEGSSSSLIGATVRVLGGDPEDHGDAVRHAGIAVAAVGAARALPYQIATGRISAPADICRAAGLDPAQPTQWPDGVDLRPLALPLMGLADVHLRAARRAVRSVPKELKAAFLPMSLAGLYLNRLVAAGSDPRRLVARPIGIARPMTVLFRAMLGRP